MNKTFVIIFELLIVIFVWAFITAIVFTVKLFKSLKLITFDVNKLETNLALVKQKMEEIEETADTWKVVISLYLISSILSTTKKDYKKSKKKNKSYLKSLAKTCLKNVSTINKIRTI